MYQLLDPDSDTSISSVALEKEADVLYGLIHARYIMTSSGLDRMLKKYRAGDFGVCPRFYCENQVWF